MNFLALQTELYARGVDFLNQEAAGQTRAKQWLNDAYLEDITANEPWDFLLISISGPAPLTISDLDSIVSVKDTATDSSLYVADLSQLEATFGDLADTGDPWCYYLSSQTVLSTFPVSSNSLTVRYYKVPTALTADGDTPLLPARWHGLIVDGAMVRMYWDSDEADMADRLETRFQRRLEHMRASEQVRTLEPYVIGSVDE